MCTFFPSGETRIAMGEGSESNRNLGSIPSLKIARDKLERAGFEFIRLLKAIDSCGYNLYEGPALNRAIWRYETMWLPLLGAISIPSNESFEDSFVAPEVVNKMRELAKVFAACKEFKSLPVVPPLDVAWVWYLHRLSVDVYLSDVTKVIGAPVAPDISSSFQYGTSNRSRKAAVWNLAKHGSEKVEDDSLSPEDAVGYEDFFPSYLQRMVDVRGKVQARQTVVGSVTPVKHKSKFCYSICDAANVHRGVLWLYMRNHDLSKSYLRDALLRYEKYIVLNYLRPTEDFEPTDDIDFVWRIHSVLTIDYLSDDLIYSALSPETEVTQNQEDVSINFRGLMHNDAQIVHSGKSGDALQAKERIDKTSMAWREVFGNEFGVYFVKSHAPRLTPRGKRDGYLQDVLHRAILNRDDYSSSDSSASSSGCASGLLRNKVGLTTVAETNRPGTSPSSSKAAVEALSPKVDVTSPVAGTKKVPRFSSREETSNVEKNFDGNHSSSSPCGGEEDSLLTWDSKKHRREMKKREAEEREIQLHNMRAGHTLGGRRHGSKRSRLHISRVQLFRGAAFSVVGIILVVYGIVRMSTTELTTATTMGAGQSMGEFVFFIGLLCFLLATAAMQRPDLAERLQKKEDARLLKLLKLKEKQENRQYESDKKTVVTAIQEYSFSANEGATIIGGAMEPKYVNSIPAGAATKQNANERSDSA